MERIRGSERGFTLIELAIVLIIIGLLAVPLFRFLSGHLDVARTQATKLALEAAGVALIAFAGKNNGCLPFAADFEGGFVDTNWTGHGARGYADTGIGVPNQRGGDLPWADLGLAAAFLDGDGLRIQYFVASPYTDSDTDPTNGIDCAAGFRGVQWVPGLAYAGSDGDPKFVYYTFTDQGTRTLCKITGLLPPGMTPAEGGGQRGAPFGLPKGPPTNKNVPPGPPKKKSGSSIGDFVDCFYNPIPAALLELRRGPNVTADPTETDVLSAQNVFVLIAPGDNRNDFYERFYIRDSNHAGDVTGEKRASYGFKRLQLNATNVDAARFSNTRNVIPPPPSEKPQPASSNPAEGDGDDTLLVMPFAKYKLALHQYGLNMEALCETFC